MRQKVGSLLLALIRLCGCVACVPGEYPSSKSSTVKPFSNTTVCTDTQNKGHHGQNGKITCTVVA